MKKAFTLIELLVVMAIIAILAAMLMPALARARAASRKAVCKTNEHNLGVGYMFYLNDNDQTWPHAPGTWAYLINSKRSLAFLYPAYVNSLKTFDCPSGQAGDAMYDDSGDPIFIANSDYIQDDVIFGAVPARVILGDLNEDGINHRGKGAVPGANLLCVDLSVHWSEAPQGSTEIPNPSRPDKDPDVYKFNVFSRLWRGGILMEVHAWDSTLEAND